MRQEDLLVKQAEQLGQVLAIIFSMILGLKGKKIGGLDFSTVNPYFDDSQIGFNITDLLAISNNDFISTLQQNKGFNNSNLEQLAEILLTVANEMNLSDKKTELYQKSLLIYEYIVQSDKTFVDSREARILDLKKQLAQS